ncbi:DNA polymerase IV [Endozoicomonadaceae bacterium StTr2]
MLEKGKAAQGRKVIHADCDCFYAAVELRDNPDLRGRPLAVGGMPDKRGVIATCNYEAREFGVRSAMASGQALRLCPDLLIVPPRMKHYREVSKEIHAIFADYTDLIEPLSLDEAYLDVSDSERCRGSATLMAKELRQRVRKEVGIVISAGVAPNKFLAKIASDWNKPDGLFVITPDQVDEFVKQLPVNKLHGVGKVTAEKLRKKRIETCGDLRKYSKLDLAKWFGRFGEKLHELAYGIDNRAVETSRRRKSLSVEHTYDQDLPDIKAVQKEVFPLLESLESRWERISREYLPTKRFVKLKFNDFTQTTLETLLPAGESPFSPAEYQKLFKEAFERKNLPVRLAGIGIRLHDLKPPEGGRQLSLFGD